MASFSTSISLLQLQSSLSHQFLISNADKYRIPANTKRLCLNSIITKPSLSNSKWVFSVMAFGDNGTHSNRKWSSPDWSKFVATLRSSVNSIPPLLPMIKRQLGSNNYGIGIFVAFAILVFTVQRIFSRRARYYNEQGSVADLVKRGQLRSDRRGISQPLMFDDPFNNPLVKIDKDKSTVEMCGKVYRLAPVTLTKEQQSSHQKRRSRAYQWKRPTIFLKEGDPIPPDVDPDTIRWIPANHPFATTVNDMDEELAQSNVYQKEGVPFRIKAEHEALQRKLEALQNQQKLNKVAINPSSSRDFERPFKSSKQHGQLEHNPLTNQVNTSNSNGSFTNDAETEDRKKP